MPAVLASFKKAPLALFCMSERNDLLKYPALLLADGLLDPRLHDWFAKTCKVTSYKYLKLPSLVEWKNAYDREQEWWYCPAVQTTPEIRAEMKNFHAIINRKRTDFQRSDYYTDMFTQEKKELLDEIVDRSQFILECVKHRQVRVPKDDLGMAIRHAVERVAPEAKYKKEYATTRETKDTHGDESLVVAGIYHCLNGVPTNIVSSDKDVRKLAQKGIAALSEQLDVEETLSKHPLRVYLMPPGSFDIHLAFISRAPRQNTVSAAEEACVTVPSLS